MKNLLAACTTVLRAARLEYGGKSATRQARKRLRISNQTVVRKAGSAVLAAVLAVGMVGAAVVVPAASASTVVSDQNDPSYWQALYPGSACTKPVGELNVSTYTLPALPSGTDYVAVIVKAGSPNSVDVFNNIFDATHNTMPYPGVVVSTSTEKTISHIIICTVTPTVVTPVGPTVVQASTCGEYGTVTPVTTAHVNYVVTSFNTTTGDWTVTATPESTAYKFADGVTGIFNGNAGAYVECTVTPTVVTPEIPTFADAMCTESETSTTPSYTIADTTGVQYQVSSDGTTFTNVDKGLHVVAVGSKIWVKPVAKDGYGLSSSATFGPHKFNAAEGCVFMPPTLGLLTPKASSTPITCDTAGSYTLVNDEGLIWLVDGVEQPAGTYDVSQTSTVSVIATTDPSIAGLEANAQTAWMFPFTKPNCELTTLALPGSNGTLASTGSNGTLAGGLLLGLIFMMFGAGALTVSRVRRRTN